MIIDVRLAQLRSSGGQHLQFPHAGVTCIVGGNNVGKSRLLREIDIALREPGAKPATFSDLQIAKPAIDEAQARGFLEEVGIKNRPVQGQEPRYTPATGAGGQLTAA